MPLSMIRRSTGGRPVLATFCGSIGPISSHCSSVSSCRLMIWRPPCHQRYDSGHAAVFRQSLVGHSVEVMPNAATGRSPLFSVWVHTMSFVERELDKCLELAPTETAQF